MSKMSHILIKYTLGLGGDIIKRQWTFALLLALSIAVSVFPLAESTNDQFASSNNAQFGLKDDNKIVEVNAKSSIKSLKKSKKVKYKKVKAATKKVKVKVRYKYKGKWRYKYVYKTYTPPMAAGSPVTSTSTSRNVGAYNVVITSQYVYATGRCTCSLSTDYNYHTRIFFNYNPATNRWGVLNFEQGPAPKTCPEGMWYDTITDMDFCLYHGKSHDNRNVYLIPYEGVVNGVYVVNGYFTDKVYTPPVDTTKTTDSSHSTGTTDSTNINTTDSTNGTNTTDS